MISIKVQKFDNVSEYGIPKKNCSQIVFFLIWMILDLPSIIANLLWYLQYPVSDIAFVEHWKLFQTLDRNSEKRKLKFILCNSLFLKWLAWTVCSFKQIYLSSSSGELLSKYDLILRNLCLTVSIPVSNYAIPIKLILR
jgi:hypothetical protein